MGDEMKKLIQTNFVYQMKGWKLPFELINGSYLGKKRASLETIRKFCKNNGTEIVRGSIKIINSFESQWIAK